MTWYFDQVTQAFMNSFDIELRPFYVCRIDVVIIYV